MSYWKTLSVSDGFLRVSGPRQPGVYAIFLDGELTYIGSTINIADRLAGHRLNRDMHTGLYHTPWGQCRTLGIKCRHSRRYGDWLMHEVRLIFRLQPVGNVTSKKHASQRMAW